MNKPIAFLLCVCLLAPAAVRAGQRLPASDRDRDDIVKYATALESDALSKKAKRNREKALAIIGRAPDLTVEPCGALLGDLLLSKKLGARELLVQIRISGAKFVALHPDSAGDREHVLAAGLEGAISAYRAMRSVNPLVQIDEFDELAGKSSDELGDVVRDALADCDRR